MASSPESKGGLRGRVLVTLVLVPMAALFVLVVVLGVRPARSAEMDSSAVASEGHALHVSTQVGWWDFNKAFRFEDDLFYGVRAGAWLSPSMSLEIDLEQIRTRDEEQQEWSRAVFLNLHGRYQWRPERLFSPGVLAGVSFMAADNELAPNSITEGLDLGPTLSLRLGERTNLLAELLFRYTSLKRHDGTGAGSASQDEAVVYVWSHGLRLGVDFAF